MGLNYCERNPVQGKLNNHCFHPVRSSKPSVEGMKLVEMKCCWCGDETRELQFVKHGPAHYPCKVGEAYVDFEKPCVDRKLGIPRGSIYHQVNNLDAVFEDGSAELSVVTMVELPDGSTVLYDDIYGWL